MVQPIIGAMSYSTAGKWGRRTPYFLFGALLCSLGLFFIPLSGSLLMAASLLWLLDAGNNITMEPYRAYVSDRLDDSQHEIWFPHAERLYRPRPNAGVPDAVDPRVVRNEPGRG